MNRTMSLTLGLWLMLAGLAGSTDALAGSKVNVKVQVVHATKSHKKVDSRLGRVSKHLKRLGYTGFQLLESEQAELTAKGKKKSFAIAGGRRLSVAVLSKDSERVRLRVQVQGKKGKLVDTTVSIKRNGFFVVAGPKHKGGILVLPISARY